MLNTMNRAKVRQLGTVKASGLAIGALVLGSMCAPVMAQQLLSAKSVQQLTEVAGDRLCTAGFNADYGWFNVSATDHLGVLEFPGLLTPGACGKATTAGLAANLGTLNLPLVEGATYALNSSSKVTLRLLEPALCEDYYGGAAGNSNWSLEVMDAKGNALRFGVNPGTLTMPGVTSLDYTLSSGVLAPDRADTTLPWLRCHSGLAVNAGPPSVNPVDPNYIFADGYEQPLANLRVDFIDGLGNALPGDVIEQGVGANVSVRVRVSNIGSWPATLVRLREFVPTNNAFLNPVVTRVGCIDHGASGNDNVACNSGSGTIALAEDLPTLAAGAHRDYTLTRQSSSLDYSATQAQALIQVAAFSDPANGLDGGYADNSRSLRIKIVDQVNVTRAVSTDGSPGGVGGTISRTSAPVACAAEAGALTVCPPGTTGLVYGASANAGFTFVGFTGCAGTTIGVSETGGSLTTTSGNSCTLTANFRSKPVVTASVSGANGTITPPSQDVHYSTQAFFTVNPSTGYEVDAINGCGGVVHHMGNTWKTSAQITANCAVSVSFKVAMFDVSASSVGNGTVTPSSTVVQHNQTATFTVTPAANHQVIDPPTGTCPLPGFWFGNQYLIPNITADCSVQFEFELITYAVTVSPAPNGGAVTFIDSANAPIGTTANIPHGQKARFTIVPDGQHTFVNNPANVSVGGGCSMSSLGYDFALQKYVGETAAITAAGCTVSATFTPN